MNSRILTERFKRAFVEKFLSLPLSVKLWIINSATVLCYLGKIGDVQYCAIVCTIGLGKTLVDAVDLYTKPKPPEDPTDV